MKIIETSYKNRFNFQVNKLGSSVPKIREQNDFQEVSPIYYHYPHISFEGKSKPLIKLIYGKLGNTFKDKIVLDSITELAGKYRKDFASVQTELTQKLTPVLQSGELKVVRSEFQKFSDMVLQDLQGLRL